MMPDQLDQEVIGEDEGQEDRHRCQRGRQDRTPYFLRPLRHRTFGRSAGSREAIDILEHHHTVVEQHPDRQRHPDQRQAVDRYPEGIKEIEGGINGDRNREGDKKHQPEIFQKQPEDQHRQQSAHQRQVDNLVDVILHRLRRVFLYDDLHVQVFQFLI